MYTNHHVVPKSMQLQTVLFRPSVSSVHYSIHTFGTTGLYTRDYSEQLYRLLMRDEKEERKKQARSNKQTNKAKQRSTPKAVTFPKKNELPRVRHAHQ